MTTTTAPAETVTVTATIRVTRHYVTLVADATGRETGLQFHPADYHAAPAATRRRMQAHVQRILGDGFAVVVR